MTSIRHSDTPALLRRRELVANELRLIDAELERRGREATQEQCRDRAAWQEAANARGNPFAGLYPR
jgi:tRNA threonylcarbamoyladenosine modification (KEOPS) complex Cgi121 subunit